MLCCQTHAESPPSTVTPAPAGEKSSRKTPPGYVGVSLKSDGAEIVIQKMQPGMPAARSGMLRLGDRIVSIAEKGQAPADARGKDMPTVLSMIKGSLGTEIRLVVSRVEKGERIEIEVNLTRGPLVDSVFSPGDLAPGWKTGKWIQGEPVEKLERGKVYLIECWATWCGPCVAGIPHLNDLHLKYKDRGLVVIGQNVAQKDELLVRKFVRSMGKKMTYRVVMDEMPATAVENSLSGTMLDAWIQPQVSQSPGIPTAFLVGKDGRMAWSGHPKDLDATTIETTLAAK